MDKMISTLQLKVKINFCEQMKSDYDWIVKGLSHFKLVWMNRIKSQHVGIIY